LIINEKFSTKEALFISLNFTHLILNYPFASFICCPNASSKIKTWAQKSKLVLFGKLNWRNAILMMRQNWVKT